MADEEIFNTTLIGVAGSGGSNLKILANLAPDVDDPDEIVSVLADFDLDTGEWEIVQEFDGWLTSMVEDSQGRLLAVSADGELVTLGRGVPSVRDLVCPGALNSLCSLPGGGVAAVGDAGAIRLLPTPSSRPIDTAAAVDLYEVSAWSDNVIVAVGDEGTVLFGNGLGWQPVIVPTNVCLYAVLILGEQHFLVAGVGGVILEFTSSGISERDVPRDLTIYALAHFQGSLYFACGDDGLWRIAGGGACERISDEIAFSLSVVDSRLIGFGNNVLNVFNGDHWSRHELDF